MQVDGALKDMNAPEITLTFLWLCLFAATFSPVNPLFWLVRLLIIRVSGLSFRRVLGQCVPPPLEPTVVTLTILYTAFANQLLNTLARVAARMQQEISNRTSE